MLISFFLVFSRPEDCPSDDYTFTQNVSDSQYQNCILLKNIKFSSTVIRIGVNGFFGCTGITSILFEEGCEIIDGDAFGNCSSLTKIVFPKTLTTLMPSFNEGCTSLKLFEMTGDGAFFSVDGQGFLYNANKTILYTTPAGWEGDAHILATVEHNVRFAFYPRPGMKAIFVDEGNKYYSSHFGVLYNRNYDTLRQVPQGLAVKTYVIHDGCLNIFSHAFQDCKSIDELFIPHTLLTIDPSAFQGAEIDQIYACQFLWENISQVMPHAHFNFLAACISPGPSQKKPWTIQMTPLTIGLMVGGLLIGMIAIIVLTVYLLKLRERKHHIINDGLL